MYKTNHVYMHTEYTHINTVTHTVHTHRYTHEYTHRHTHTHKHAEEEPGTK